MTKYNKYMQKLDAIISRQNIALSLQKYNVITPADKQPYTNKERDLHRINSEVFTTLEN